MATKATDKVITDLACEFVKDLGINATVEVSKQTEGEEVNYLVALTGEDLGVLIGYHGETLDALQLVLSLIASKKLDQWTHLTLDAGDWRAKRSETLQEMAVRAAERVIATGEEVALPPMSAADRRLVHLALQEHANVTTESVGEEGYRRVVVRIRH